MGAARPLPPRTSLAMGAVAGAAVLAIWLGTGLGAAAAVPAAGGSSGMAGMPGMTMPGTSMPRMSMPGAMATGSRLDATCRPSAPGPWLPPFTQRLTVPTRVDLTGGTTSATLEMTGGKHAFHTDLPATSTLGYAVSGDTGGDGYRGPTIEARKGRPVNVGVRNRFGVHPLAAAMDQTFMGMTGTDETAPRGVIHLHGGHSEPSQDGLPQATIAANQATSYKYVNDQDTAGLWYHDHAWA